MEAKAVKRLFPVPAHDQVVGHGGVPADAGGQPVLRDVGQTQLADLARVLSPDALAADGDLAALYGAHTGDGL